MTANIDIYKRLPEAMLSWYENNHRQLPWRQDQEPYHIWLSEIMLQQTRVEAVKGYYARFLAAIPDVAALAKAEDGLLEKLWEGLGYYSRVRNLKKAACRIMQVYGGQFPREYAQILALPGIGPYTAGAICSIAFDLPTPAVDGNVLRLVTRLTADATPIDSAAYKKQVEDALRMVYPAQAGMFTQALMELGATVCGPNRKPDCGNCPCYAFCKGRMTGTPEQFPVKTPKKPRRVEEMTVFILSCGGTYSLEKRPGKGVLAGMWQFPNIPGKADTASCLEQVENFGLKPKQILAKVERKHIFTHIQWDMCGVYLEVKEKNDGFVWMTEAEIEQQAALPTAFRQFWDERMKY